MRLGSKDIVVIRGHGHSVLHDPLSSQAGARISATLHVVPCTCLVDHGGGTVAMGTIGTSQEGAHEGTIRELALTAKRVGVDLHHIGDAGLTGIARPENIYAYSVAIRGVRHTWSRMGRNVRASWGYRDPG